MSVSRSHLTRSLRLSATEWIGILVLLLLAFLLRTVAYTEGPPGIIHDEVRNWLNTRLILQGDIRALYPYGGGRESFYLFIQTLSFTLVGDNILAARLPSLAFSMIGVSAIYSLSRRLLGRASGLLAAAGFAFSFWALMFARLAVRTGSMPVMALITAYAFERLTTSPRPPLWRYALAGVLLGITLYTYPSSLIFPVIVFLWLAFSGLLGWREWRPHWKPLVISFVIPVLMAIPLILAWSDPAISARADEVNAPLEALMAGDIQPVLDNVAPVLGVFSVQGDHGLEFNIQDQPIFPTPLLAGLFYVGFVLSVIGLFAADSDRRPGLLLILLWVGLMLAPTLVTERPVNPSRTIGLLGIVYVLPAVVLSESVIRWIPRYQWPAAVVVSLVALVAMGWEAVYTSHVYFVEWVNNPVVRFLYQDEYRVLAKDIRQEIVSTPLTVGGLTPDEMDPASLRLLLSGHPSAETIGYFDPQTSLLVPSSESGASVVIPDFVTLHPDLAAHIEGWGFRSDPPYSGAPYTRWLLPGNQAGLFPAAEQVNIDYEADGHILVTLAGVEPLVTFAPGENVTLVSYWRTHLANEASLRIFAHLTDGDAHILAQSDVLGVPATQWRDGDLVIQAHDFVLPPDADIADLWLNIGLYDPETGVRLITPDQPSGDYSRLPLTVEE